MKTTTMMVFPLLMLWTAGCEEATSADVATVASPAAPAAPAAPKVNVDDPQVLAGLLGELVGDETDWRMPRFAELSEGMSCDDVRARFPSMEECRTDKTHAFPKAKVSGDPLVSSYKFAFRDGGLSKVNVIFHRHIDKEAFKTASLPAFEAKWGALKPDKRDKDILTWVGTDMGNVQRVYMADHWEIKTDVSE